MGTTYFAVKNVDEKYYNIGRNILVQALQSTKKVSDNVLRVTKMAAETGIFSIGSGVFFARSMGNLLHICVSHERIDFEHDKHLQKKMHDLIVALNGHAEGTDINGYSFHGVKIVLDSIRYDAMTRMMKVLAKARRKKKATRMVEIDFPGAKSSVKSKKEKSAVKTVKNAKNAKNVKTVKNVKKNKLAKRIRRGESAQNEIRFAKLLKHSLHHFENASKSVRLRIEERNNPQKGFELLDVKNVDHCGCRTGYDLADISLRLSNEIDFFVSLKMPSAEELNGQKCRLLSHPYFQRAFEMFLAQTDILDISEDESPSLRRYEGTEYKRINFVEGTTGIAMPIPRDLMSWMLFGEESHTKCGAIVVNHFLPGDEENVVYEEFDDCCQITIKVDRVILSVDDAIGTTMEPWLIMRKRSSDRGMYLNGTKYSGMHFYATTKSRILSGKSGNRQQKIRVLEALPLHVLDVAA